MLSSRLFTLLLGLAFLLYPALVFYGLQNFSVQSVALIVLLAGLARMVTLGKQASAVNGSWLAMAAALGALVTLVLNSSLGVKLYPVLINAICFFVFALSLKHPPTVIERLARIRHPQLPESGVIYTRKVTIAWCVFFIINGAIAAATVFLSERIWALYNGLISYLCIGLMFAIEYLVRPKHP